MNRGLLFKFEKKMKLLLWKERCYKFELFWFWISIHNTFLYVNIKVTENIWKVWLRCKNRLLQSFHLKFKCQKKSTDWPIFAFQLHEYLESKLPPDNIRIRIDSDDLSDTDEFHFDHDHENDGFTSREDIKRQGQEILNSKLKPKKKKSKKRNWTKENESQETQLSLKSYFLSIFTHALFFGLSFLWGFYLFWKIYLRQQISLFNISNFITLLFCLFYYYGMVFCNKWIINRSSILFYFL